METWKAIPGYEGRYEASSLGRVRSLDMLRTYSDGRKPYSQKGRVLKLIRDADGYARVSLSKDARQKQFLVNRLVCMAFYGPPAAGQQACHGDGNAGNDRLGNLRWDTQGGNEADKVAHGTSNQGESHGLAKLSESNVREIFLLLGAGVLHKDIAAKFDIHIQHISRIKRGKRWGYLHV